jgi:transposase InsO family protein
LASRFGRYGYKRITDLLQMAGWPVNQKRVQRIWRAEGLKVPKRQPKRGRLWLTLFIEPGSPWETGYVESFNSKLRDELLDGEIFYALREAQILTADWRRLYNGLRPHSSCGRRPPAPETIVYQGFKLADVAPPAPTTEVATALT